MARTPQAKERARARRPTAAGPAQIEVAICPVCGMFRAGKFKGAGGEERTAWNLRKEQHLHLGALLESRGRGSLRVVHYIDTPSVAGSLYERVKKQLLDGLQVWIERGWLDRADVAAILASPPGPAPAAAPPPAAPAPPARARASRRRSGAP